MKKKILLVIACTAFGYWGHGQSLSPSVIAVDGAQNSTVSMSLEWTLGELFVESVPIRNGYWTEGFHQPLLEKITEVPGTLSPLEAISGYQIEVWPNPSNSLLNIQVEAAATDEVLIELYDVMGRKVISKTSPSPFELVQLDLSQNAPGLYLIKFLEKDGTLIKTILNTKH